MGGASSTHPCDGSRGAPGPCWERFLAGDALRETANSSDKGKSLMSARGLSLAVTAGALMIAVAHLLWPTLAIDAVTLTRLDWTQRSASVLLIDQFRSLLGLRIPFPRPRIHPYQGRPARLRADPSCPYLIIFRDPELRASRASRGSTW